MYCRKAINYSSTFSSTWCGQRNGVYIFRNPPAELPSYSGLDGKRDVIHLDLTGSPGVFGVHQSIRKDLRGVAMREFE